MLSKNCPYRLKSVFFMKCRLPHSKFKENILYLPIKKANSPEGENKPGEYHFIAVWYKKLLYQVLVPSFYLQNNYSIA